LLGIIAQITEILLEKLNVPQEEAEAFAERIKERKMGELLANFEGWDVQALRREAKEAAEKAREEAKEEAIGKMLSVLKTFNIPKDAAKQQLMKEYELSEAEADEKLERYW
ncbi:MAG: hypothetical protein NC434_15490, partial [Ruminococcus sp.]|nr:hypothetical protein [Ruminococcus sp.]